MIYFNRKLLELIELTGVTYPSAELISGIEVNSEFTQLFKALRRLDDGSIVTAELYINDFDLF